MRFDAGNSYPMEAVGKESCDAIKNKTEASTKDYLYCINYNGGSEICRKNSEDYAPFGMDTGSGTLTVTRCTVENNTLVNTTCPSDTFKFACD